MVGGVVGGVVGWGSDGGRMGWGEAFAFIPSGKS